MNFLQRYFQISEKKSTLWKECLGGLTTFITMAYILVVNPAILGVAFESEKMGLGPLTVATGLTCVFGCLLMGLYANRPIGVAPYMGENVFLATIVITTTVTWQQMLGTVFVSGVAFFLLTLFGLRKWLADSISPSLKFSFAVGIGLFLFFVGAKNTGLVISGMAIHNDPNAAPVLLGSLKQTRVALAILGFFLMTVLIYWRVPGGILIGIVSVACLGYLCQVGAELPSSVVEVPWAEKYDLLQIAGQLDIVGVLQLSFLPVLLTLFLVSFLDTIGTLIALGSSAEMLDEEGNFPQIEKPMLVDSITCMFSGLVGTTTSGAYIESTTGIREGARTGLAAVVTGLLFLISLFILPLIEPLQKMGFAYGPALMAVGVLMIGAVKQIKFEDFTETVPAVVTITMMVFTYNIANGLTAGLALYPLFKIATGRWRDLNFGSVILGIACWLYFVAGNPH